VLSPSTSKPLKSSFISGFLTRIMQAYAFSIPLIHSYIPCTPHALSIITITTGEEYKLWGFWLWNFLQQ
jgi:hypothetical protein